MTQRPILIAGPTASGKSEPGAGPWRNAIGGHRHQRRFHAGLSGAGDPDGPARLRGRGARAARAVWPCAGGEAYSVGRWLEDVQRRVGAGEGARLAAGHCRAAPASTFRHCSKGCRRSRPIPDDIRAYWRARGGRPGRGRCMRRSPRSDPEMAARLSPSDTQRLTRALEVIDRDGLLAGSVAARSRDAAAGRGSRHERLLVMPERQDCSSAAMPRFEAYAGGGRPRRGKAACWRSSLDPALPAMRARRGAPAGCQCWPADLSRGEPLPAPSRTTRHYMPAADHVARIDI